MDIPMCVLYILGAQINLMSFWYAQIRSNDDMYEYRSDSSSYYVI